MWTAILGIISRIFGPLLAVFGGWTLRGQRQKIKELKDAAKTKERMDQAEVGADPDIAERWLRERQRKRGLPKAGKAD